MQRGKSKSPHSRGEMFFQHHFSNSAPSSPNLAVTLSWLEQEKEAERLAKQAKEKARSKMSGSISWSPSNFTRSVEDSLYVRDRCKRRRYHNPLDVGRFSLTEQQYYCDGLRNLSGSPWRNTLGVPHKAKQQILSTAVLSMHWAIIVYILYNRFLDPISEQEDDKTHQRLRETPDLFVASRLSNGTSHCRIKVQVVCSGSNFGNESLLMLRSRKLCLR